MSNNVFLSIVLPIYNVEKYLERCISSILNQQFKSYEMILVDDGSTDDSPMICDRYAKEYSFISVVHKVNGGLSSARNAGLEVASGEYVFWVDSDDWIEQGSLQLLYNCLQKNHTDIVKFNYFRHADTSERIASTAMPGLYCRKDQIYELVHQALKGASRFGLSVWSHIYKSSFLRDTNLIFISEREIGSEDYLFNLQAYALANSVLILDECFYYYDLRQGSLSQRYKENIRAQYTNLYCEYRDTLKRIGLYDEFEKHLLHYYVWSMFDVIGHEYTVTYNHSIHEGRAKVKVLLSQKELRYALKHVPYNEVNIKRRVLLIWMRFKCEPLLYYLFKRNR